MIMYNIFFYKDKKGNEPVKEYIILSLIHI